MTDVADVLRAMLARYAEAEGDPEEVLYRVIGDPDEAGITEAEWRRRCALICEVIEACRCDLAALGDVVRSKRAVVAVLRAGLEHASA